MTFDATHDVCPECQRTLCDRRPSDALLDTATIMELEIEIERIERDRDFWVVVAVWSLCVALIGAGLGAVAERFL